MCRPGRFFVGPVLAHRIHGTGIFTYIWLRFMVNVGRNMPYMDPMGWSPKNPDPFPKIRRIYGGKIPSNPGHIGVVWGNPVFLRHP